MSAPFFNSVRIGVLYGAIFGAAAGMEAVYASGLKLKDPEAMTAIGMLVTAGSFAGAAIGGYIERFFFNNAFRV